MRDILRWVLHWLSGTPPAEATIGTVVIGDRRVYGVTIGDRRVGGVVIGDRTGGGDE